MLWDAQCSADALPARPPRERTRDSAALGVGDRAGQLDGREELGWAVGIRARAFTLAWNLGEPVRGSVTLMTRTDGGWASVSIADTGCGAAGLRECSQRTGLPCWASDRRELARDLVFVSHGTTVPGA